MEISINISFNVKTGKYTIKSNIVKKEELTVIEEFLRTQIGAGADHSKPEIREVYRIDIKLDLRSDTFIVSDNCGNEGLRDGILMNIAKRLSKDNKTNPIEKITGE
jgi:hypothetical protein